jgi:ribosome-interacting GTPase 1
MTKHGRIRVAVVGGLSRAGDLWSRAGDALGVELEHHDGRTRGSGVAEIVAAVRRADVVVIITDPNSHNGVAAARRAAIAAARPHVLVKHLRPGGLATVLAQTLAAARGAEATP